MKRRLPRTTQLCFWGLSTSLFVVSSGDTNVTNFDDGMENYNVDEKYGSWRSYLSYSLAFLCITAFFISMVFMGVVSTTTKFTYNHYVIGLLLSDTLMNLVLGIRCIYEGTYNKPAAAPLLLCRLQYVGLGFYVCNLYLDAIVGHEIYKLLWNSYRRRRISPPPKKKVLWQIGVTYLLVGLFSTWLVLPMDWSLLTVENDPYCIAPLGSDLITTQAAMVIYVAVILPPVIYCCWIHKHVVQGKLLPTKGRSRALAMYYVRIVFLFLFFYTPMTAVVTWYNAVENRNSALFFLLSSAFTLMNPLQNLCSVVIFSQKDDIQTALWKLFSWAKQEPTNLGSSQWGMEDTYDQSHTTSGVESIVGTATRNITTKSTSGVDNVIDETTTRNRMTKSTTSVSHLKIDSRDHVDKSDDEEENWVDTEEPCVDKSNDKEEDLVDTEQPKIVSRNHGNKSDDEEEEWIDTVVP